MAPGSIDAEAGYVERGNRRVQWQDGHRITSARLQLEPLSETMLLAAANQAFLNGDRALACNIFSARLVDPGSIDAHEGLHRAQTGEGEPPPFVAPAEWKR